MSRRFWVRTLSACEGIEKGAIGEAVSITNRIAAVKFDTLAGVESRDIAITELEILADYGSDVLRCVICHIELTSGVRHEASDYCTKCFRITKELAKVIITLCLLYFYRG